MIEVHDAIVFRAVNAMKTSIEVTQPACFSDHPKYTPICHHKAHHHASLSMIRRLSHFVSVSSASPNCSRCLASALSSFLSRAALVFARLASISSLITLSRAFSALALWIWSSVRHRFVIRESVKTYVLNQCSLVLECVTLAQMIELVVKVLINLAARTILDQQTTENTETTHPDNLAVYTISLHPSIPLSRLEKI